MPPPFGHREGAHPAPFRRRPRNPRAAWLCAPALIAVLFVLSCSGTAKPPSIVILLVDTLRFDYLGCYGFQGPISPNVDALAGESHLFLRAYAQAPWTKPSVASLFTSLHPTGHGVVNHEGTMWAGANEAVEKGVLAENAYTMAEALRDRGYETAAFVANPWTTREYGFQQGFDVFDDTSSGMEVHAEEILDKAEAWLAERRDERPFFLYLHFMDVHGPYLAPDSCYHAIQSSPDLRFETMLPSAVTDRIPTYLRHGSWRFGEALARLGTWQARYGSGMRYLDSRLGPFLDRLTASGVLDHAILVFTSDHGEELDDHGGWSHGMNLYEDQIHVPLLIRPPGGLPATKRHSGMVRLVDVLPTLCGLAGIPVPAELDGKDLSPPGPGAPWSEVETSFACATTTDPDLVSLNVDTFKIIMNAARDTVQVFDLEDDPGEGRDLAPTRPRLTEELTDYMKRTLQSQEERLLFHPPSDTLPEFRREQLRSLGYLN